MVNSNTTLVSINRNNSISKAAIIKIQIQLLFLLISAVSLASLFDCSNSNTTLVSINLFHVYLVLAIGLNSNTTLVSINLA